MPFRVFSLANPALQENSNKRDARVNGEFIFSFVDGIDSDVSLFFWPLLQSPYLRSPELLLIFQASGKPPFPLHGLSFGR